MFACSNDCFGTRSVAASINIRYPSDGTPKRIGSTMNNFEKAAAPFFWELTKFDCMIYFLALLCGMIGLYLLSMSYSAGFVLIALLFVFFVYKPEASLAIFYNCTIIYFYLLFKLNLSTESSTTAIFYAFLLAPAMVNFLITSKRKFKICLADMLFLLLCILIILSYLAQSRENQLAYKKIRYLPFLVIAPYMEIRFLNTMGRVKQFLNYTVLCTTTLMLPAYYELLYNPLFAFGTRFSMYRFDSGGVEGIRDNPIAFGMTFAVLSLVMLICLVEIKKSVLKYVIIIFPSTYLIVVSGSRGAVVSFLITVVIYLLSKRRLGLRTGWIAVILIGLLISSYALLPNENIEYYQYSFSASSLYDESSSIYARNVLRELAIRDFIANPIFGIGFGNSVEGIGNPHNIVLELLAELGVIGCLIFSALLWSVWNKGVRAMRAQRDSGNQFVLKMVFGLFLLFFVESMFSGNLSQESNIFMSIGLILSVSDIIAQRKTLSARHNRTFEGI